MKIKRVIAAVVGSAAAVGAVAGGIYGYKAYQDQKLVAEVQPVSNINMGYWGDSATSYGMVTNDSSQEIYLDSSKSAKQVFVQEGDTVKVGDPLMEYDMAEVQIDIERKKIELNTIENNLAMATHKLDSLKNAKPVDKTPPKINTEELQKYEEQDRINNSIPETDEKDPNIYNFLTATSIPYNVTRNEETGELVFPAGTAEDPIFITVMQMRMHTEDFSMRYVQRRTRTPGKHVVFYVCRKDADGKMLMEPDAEGKLKPVIDTDITDHTAQLNGNSIPADYDESRMWYLFTGKEYIPTSLADQYMEEFMEHATDWEEPKGYTKEELVKEIAETEKEIKSLDIQRRQQQLKLESLQQTAADGIVYAKVDGIVKTVGDPEEFQENGAAFLVVAGDDGLYVSGTISELLLGDISVGTVVTANAWESGMTFDATITEISDYPVSGNAMGEGNPNVSYYSYTAYIEDSSALRNGEYVDLSIATGESEAGGLFIEQAYVREENGKSYCMIADENNRLKKQYVVTGRTVYGTAVEIKSGLSEDDRIAFPYGKNAVEGVAVTDAADMMYY